VNTGLGGIALGEMFHQVAATIRDNERSGGGRLLRELIATPFDPVGSFNRLVSGEWDRRGPNPAEHNPVATVLRIGAGAGIVREPGPLLANLKDAERAAVIFADIKYGDSYIDSLNKPFEAFSARMLLAPGNGGLTQLVGMGRVAGKDLSRTARYRRQLELNQRFEYLNNGALRFGAQTLELGVSSRRHLTGGFWLRTLMAGDAIVPAGINAPGAGVGPRDYDFGPGVGSTLSAGIEHSGTPLLTVHLQPAWVRTVNGADANHLLAFAAAEATIPLPFRLALVVQGSYYDRLSRYGDGTRSHRRFPELRVFGALRTAPRPVAGR
jgi:hypothetical protein